MLEVQDPQYNVSTKSLTFVFAFRRSNYLDITSNITVPSYGVIRNMGLLTKDTSGVKSGPTVGVTVKTDNISQQ